MFDGSIKNCIRWSKIMLLRFPDIVSLRGLLLKMFSIRVFFFNWDSLHARLNSHYEGWSYKKKKHKKIKACRISV